jgi:hypothetical protein
MIKQSAQVNQGNELFRGVALVLLPVLFQLGLSSGFDIFVQCLFHYDM